MLAVASAMTGCAVNILTPVPITFTTDNPVPVVVLLPLLADGRFSALLNRGDSFEDVSDRFKVDTQARLAQGKLPLPRGGYTLEVSACWTFRAFIPMQGCPSTSTRFDVQPNPWLTVVDAGIETEAFVLNLRPRCAGSRSLEVIDETNRDTDYVTAFSYPAFHANALVNGRDHTFVSTGCGTTDRVTIHLDSVKPPDAGAVEKLLFIVPATYARNYPNHPAAIQTYVDGVNTVFSQSGVHKRFVVGAIKTYDDQSANCPNTSVNDPCDILHTREFYAVDMISMFHSYTLPGGNGGNWSTGARFSFAPIAPANPNQDFFRTDPSVIVPGIAVMARQLAALFNTNIPDYAGLKVRDQTGVEPFFVSTVGASFSSAEALPVGYSADPLAFNFNFLQYAPLSAVRFGTLTKDIIELNTSFAWADPRQVSAFWQQFSPPDIALTITDLSGNPVGYADVAYYCLTRAQYGDVAETIPRAHVLVDGTGKGSLQMPRPGHFDEACDVMGLKVSHAGHVPVLRTMTNIELQEVAVHQLHNQTYAVTIAMPSDTENARTDCTQPDKRVAVAAKTSTSFVLLWCADSRATQYEVALRAEGQANVFTQKVTRDVSLNFTGLAASQRYRYYIAPRDSACVECPPAGAVMEGIATTGP